MQFIFFFTLREAFRVKPRGLMLIFNKKWSAKPFKNSLSIELLVLPVALSIPFKLKSPTMINLRSIFLRDSFPRAFKISEQFDIPSVPTQ